MLVLRSRPVRYRNEPFPRPLLDLARRRAHPAFATLMRDRFERYNAEAEHLQRATEQDRDLTQVAPADDVPTVSQLEWSRHAIRDGIPILLIDEAVIEET